MEFKKAYKLMKEQNYNIRLPDVKGVWSWEKDKIVVYTSKGEKNIEEISNILFLIETICRDDWEVIGYKEITKAKSNKVLSNNGRIYYKDMIVKEIIEENNILREGK